VLVARADDAGGRLGDAKEIARRNLARLVGRIDPIRAEFLFKQRHNIRVRYKHGELSSGPAVGLAPVLAPITGANYLMAEIAPTPESGRCRQSAFSPNCAITLAEMADIA